MTDEKIDKTKYWICCSWCDNEKCVKGADKYEAEMWAKAKKEEQRMYIACEICKYNCKGNCDFYGNEIDMPCYQEKQLIKEVEDACWIKKDSARKCSRCGFTYSVAANFRYCPMCGIRIRID